MSALLAARGLVKRYRLRSGHGTLTAVAGVDLDLARGECLAVVGESGSGKTTLGRLLLALIEPTAGTVRFDGHLLGALPAGELRRLRRRFQMVFQDPDGSLDPRFRVGRAIAEPLAVHRLAAAAERPERVRRLLARVGLAAEIARRFPHQLSGGERQRVGIARALATGPDLLVADEPVSGLDVSVRGQVLELLAALRRDLGLSLLLIAHDLAMVERVADRVAVMHAGRIVELAPAAEIFAAPRHPYTAGLIASIPRLEPVAPPAGATPAATPGSVPPAGPGSTGSREGGSP